MERFSGRVPPNIAKLVPYVPGKPIEEVQRELGLSRVIKLASNENPLGPSPRALEACRAGLGELHRYPDGSGHLLRSALAAHHSIDAASFVLGNGSAELIELLIRGFCAPGSADEVLSADPSFPVYQIACAIHGVRHVRVPLRQDFSYDVDKLLAAVTERTRLCFLANPNNPTGTYLPRASFERLARLLPEEVILVIDEAYFEFATAADYPDALGLRALRGPLAVLRTFSKAYGLAGLRVGYMVAPHELTEIVERVRPAFNCNLLGQRAAMAALADGEHLEKTRRIVCEGLAMVSEALRGFGLPTWPSQANFVLVDLGPQAADVTQALLRQGIIVRPIGKDALVRITVGLPEENRQLIAALEPILHSRSAR